MNTQSTLSKVLKQPMNRSEIMSSLAKPAGQPPTLGEMMRQYLNTPKTIVSLQKSLRSASHNNTMRRLHKYAKSKGSERVAATISFHANSSFFTKAMTMDPGLQDLNVSLVFDKRRYFIFDAKQSRLNELTWLASKMHIVEGRLKDIVFVAETLFHEDGCQLESYQAMENYMVDEHKLQRKQHV